MSTARAPRQIALTMSPPRRMPPSIKTSTRPFDGVEHFRQRAKTRGHAIELPPAMIRHDDRVGACIDRAARIVAGVHALDDDRTFPRVAHPAKILPRDDRAARGATPTSPHGIGPMPGSSTFGNTRGAPSPR